VGVSLEHLKRSVSRDGSDLHGIQAALKQATGGFVSQVMKVEILEPGTGDGASPNVLYAVCARPLGEDPTVHRARPRP
jgi:hypothetical protein